MPAKGRDTHPISSTEEYRLRAERFAAVDITLCLLMLLEQSNRRAAALDRKCHALMNGKDAPKVYHRPMQGALPIRGQGVVQGARVE